MVKITEFISENMSLYLKNPVGCVIILYYNTKGSIAMAKKKIQIISTIIIACIIMGFVDAVLQPGYAVKSAIKMVLFLGLPILYSLINKDKILKKVMIPDKKGIRLAMLLGACVYIVVLGAYLIFRNVFDFSALTTSLTSTTGVKKSNFLFVALYISFVNSLLEELFFRGFAFITLKKYADWKFACVFSSTLFALYHIAMMIGWFGLPVLFLSVIGLIIGGVIFNLIDQKGGTIYLSWLIHMFANFATNTIGFMLFAE